MALRGPPPRPRLSLASSTDTTSATARAADAPAVVPACPRRLQGAAARAAWRRLAPRVAEMRVLAPSDVDALTMLCELTGVYETAMEDVRVAGTVLTDDDGKRATNPSWVAACRAHDRMVRLMRDFGLTPATRANAHRVEGAAAEAAAWDALDR